MKDITWEDKKHLNLLGKTITHKNAGKGIVVGYSKNSGEPFGFFPELDSTEVVCFHHNDVLINNG